jgi:hypothetical protein
MSKFNRAVTTAVVSPVIAAPVAARTYEGGQAYERDPKSELFLLAASYMGGDGSFYEKPGQRENRLTSLARTVAVDDPAWIAKLVPWLRNAAQMRTASVVVAAEAAKALIEAGKPGARQLVAAGLQRSDEPGELIAYWRSRYGRQIPIAVKRGIADAVKRLYSEFAFLKYDSRESALRFADVIEIVNPRYHLKEYGTWRDALWRYAIEDRHGRGNEVPESLAMVRASIALRKAAAEDPGALLDTAALKAAGFTWEDALSLAGARVPKAELWTALIPVMGYMALVRNLRNFDQAGVPDDVAEQVAKRLADPAQVARSRQLPFRFLSAYRAVPSLRWSYPLDKALNASLANVPELKGRTLVLIDTSTSMNEKFQGLDGTLLRWDVAVLFGAAVALRCESADVVSFSGRSYYHEAQVAKTRAFPLRPAESLLKALERWKGDGYFLGGGTDTALALGASFKAHDRVVIVTDEQAASDGSEVSRVIPERVPLYTWNLAGEKHGHAPSGMGTRHTFGGLTDHAFRLIPMLEAGRDARWDDLFSPAD